MSIKLTILWSALASYNIAFFRELALSHGVIIQLIYQKGSPDAPYAPFDLSFCDSALEDSPRARQQLEIAIDRFTPDAVLMISWNYLHFMRIARRLRRRGVYVVSAMDNQWRSSLKQYLGILTSTIYLRPSIDTFLVPGECQAAFTRKLGYKDMLYGYYAADVASFLSDVPVTRRGRAFLFIGRLVPVKNISRLADAYQLYRKKVEKPWELKVAGTGPLTAELGGIPGVQVLGFVQPADMPRITNSARCLVLPSALEPWGVVIQEAAVAGLPVIASCRCGAATAYVRSGVNGYIVPPDPNEIASAMVRISEATDEELLAMSRASVQLASLWTPSKLAASFHSDIQRRLEVRGTRGRAFSENVRGFSSY